MEWECEPGSETCDGTRFLELCAADGLSVASRSDCSEPAIRADS